MGYNAYLNQIHYGFHKNEKNGVVYFSAPALDALGFIRHGLLRVSAELASRRTTP